jgi:uncharacterized membrane protein YkoI
MSIMHHARSALISAVFLTLVGTASAFAGDMGAVDAGAGNAAVGDARGDDHDSVYWAVKKGDALPLIDILTKERVLVGVEIVAVKFEEHDGQPYYEIYYIDKAGRRREGVFDARTGKPMRDPDE